MPGTILLDDFRDSIGDQLRRHVDGLTQLGSSAIQTIGNAPQQVAEALPQVPQVDPNRVLQDLQQHVATITQPVQQAEQQVAGAADQSRQNVLQTLQDYAGGLTSVQTPQPPQQAPAPAQSDMNPSVATGPQQNATDAVPQDTTSGRVFPVQGYNGQVDLHWGDVKGGSDLFAPRGTPVVAMEPGKVVESGSNSVGGNSVLVQGDDGLQYYYAHGDATPSVNVGDRVTAGEYLMPVGDTGDAKGRGTHLHIGIGPDIRLGADKYGGTGGDYDAVGLLRGTLAPQDQQQGPAQRAQQAVAGAVQAGQAIVGQGQKAFVDTLQPLAQQVAQRTGIDPNAMLAIAANETGWGQSQNAQQQNNLFSIQGDGSNGSRWASYKSPQESFSAFVNLISSAPRYAQAWADRANPVRFIDDLRNAGYVADEPGFPAQGWVDQVKSIYQHLPVGQPTTADDGGVSAQRQAAVLQVGDQTRPAAKQPLYAGVMQDAHGNPVADGQQNPIQVIGDVVQRGRQAVSQVASDISDAAQGAAARQQAQLPGGPFNRLEPGAEGGPPQYTNFGQAAAMSGPTSPGEAISGAVSGAVSGAQQALAPVVSGAQEAVAGAYRQGRTEAEQAEFNQRQQQDTLAAAEAMRRQSEEQAARPLDVGQQASNAWNLIVGANPPMGISYQDYQNAQDAKNQWIEQNNPLRDVLVAGGLTTGIAQQLTDLPTLLTLGPELGLARAVGPAVGERAAAAVGGRLTPEATRFVATVADRFTSGAIVGGLQNALAEVEKPGATPQSVGTALLVGIGLGGTIDVAAPAIRPTVARIGQTIIDRAAELRPALDRAGPAVGRFLTGEEGGLRLPGKPTAPEPSTATWEAFAGARAAPGEAVTATTPTARVTARVGTAPPSPPERPPAPPAGAAPPPPSGGGSPELDRLNAMYDGKTPAPSASVADRIQAVGDSLTRAFTDRQVDINRAQERYAANLGRPLRADEMAAELQRLASDPAAQVKVDEGLKPAIQSVGTDYPALRNYVTLRSNVEIADNLAARTGKAEVATDRLFSGGLTRDESAKALQDLEAQLGPVRFARVQAAADQVTAFNQSLRQRLVDSGVLDANTAAQLEAQYPNWAKTRILDYMADPAGGQGAGTKLGLNDRGLREYTLKGTTRAREDPVASTVAYAHQVERMAMKNEAFNAFLTIDQAGAKPMLREVPQSYSPTKDEVAMIGFVNGQKQKYVTDNKALGAAINGAGVLSTPEWTSAWQSIFRSLATSRNPVFLAGNAALDIPTYVLRSSVREGGPQAIPRILYELARGYGDAFQGLLQGEYRGAGTSAYLKGGGGQSGYFTGGEGQTKRAVAEMQRKNVFQIDGVGDLGRLTKDLLTLHPVEALGERIELGPRVAAMRLAERRGANPTQAIIDGRSVTVDFSQGGTVTKYLNNFIPFFNVGFQGPAQIARAFRENRGAFIATVGTLIGTPAAAAEIWNRSDPQRAKDYADVPQYVKDQGVVVMLPGDAPVDAQGNRKPMYAVVKLREWAPFAAAAREATARVLGDDTRSWQDVASSVGAGLSPTQATSAAQAGTEPLAGIPILPAAAQLEYNKDFFRNRTIVTQRGDQNASALAQALTPALQQVMDKAGANVEIRPSAIDFLIRNQGAGVGGAVLGASDLVAGRPSDVAGPTGLPVVGGLAGRFVGGQTGEELQQARDQTLTTAGRDILRRNGITVTPGAVSSSVNQIPLKLEEETRYQQLANRYIDEAIQRTAASGDFASKTQVGKQSMIDQAMQGARARAGNEVLNTIPAAEKQRRLRTKSTAA